MGIEKEMPSHGNSASACEYAVPTGEGDGLPPLKEDAGSQEEEVMVQDPRKGPEAKCEEEAGSYLCLHLLAPLKGEPLPWVPSSSLGGGPSGSQLDSVFLLYTPRQVS